MREILPLVHTFSNGLRLAYLHSDSMVAHLGVSVLAGSRYEHEGEEGLAHFLEHCIFKGTTNRRAFHVLSRLDSVGGELNAYTSKEEMVVYASFVKNHFQRAAELLADIVLNSHFPEKEIEKEKEIVLDEIDSYLDSPSDKIFDDFEALLFENHPLGINILGTPESVSSFTKEDLQRYLKRRFVSGNMVVSFVGDLPFDKVCSSIEKYFQTCSVGETHALDNPFQEQLTFSKVSKEANYQAHAVLGGYAPGYDHVDRKGIMLLANIIGGPALNSKLNLSVREKYGYSYSIEASYNPYKETGFWNVYFGTDPKNLKKTLKLVEKELLLACDKPLTESYLRMAKEQYKGHLALGLESNSGLMMSLGKSILFFNQIDTLKDITDAMQRITAIELQDIAQNYFNPKGISKLIFEIEE
ncbi:MAG: insulinase family protein [Bacteroidetes bacterium]|nr:insulinase family protein [Bacteroidota bacterium]